METLHKRLDPHKAAVLATCEALGQFHTMELFKVRDYLSFQKWLKEATGDENFGLDSKVSVDGGQTLGDKLLAAVLRKITHLAAENARQRQRIEHLEYQQGIRGRKEETQIVSLLQMCKV